MDAVPEPPDESSGNSTLVKSEDGSPPLEGGRSSPPPNCAICLGRCRNKSFTDSCLHQFCFKCLLTWSRVKTECPLCKQNFKSIIHNVKSNHQYEEYPVQQPQNEDRGPNLDIHEIVNAARRFRYRTTLTLPRRETLAIQQFLMHYPLALVDMPRPGAVPGRDRPRRSPADFRRTVYRHNLWARPLPDFTGRFRDCTPTFFRYNDSQIHRLMPWLNRELYYLLNENTGHITYVMARILELLPEHPIISPEFRAAVHCYFGERTDHFLHEFHCFASTPYDITGYDRHVQYQTDARVSGLVSEVLSSSDSDSHDSDIVMVSSSQAAGPSRTGPPPAPEPAVIPIETISHSDSDSASSEVMVIGYIKPPHQRTPELVDLLGSDSDVVVQEDTPPPVLPQLSAPEPPADLLVKIKLSLQRSPPATTGTESEQEAYTPPLRRKRSRRASSAGSFKPSDGSSTSSSYSSSSSSSSSEYESRRRRPRKRSARTSARDGVRSKKRSTRPRKGKKKTEEKPPAREGSRKGKSTNGKNVKKSSVPTEVTPPAPAECAPDSTSRKRKNSADLSDRQKNRESKKLKSVVRVMKRISDSGSGAGTSKTEAAEDSAEAYASSMSPILSSSRSPVVSLSRSHEAAGSSRSYEVGGSSRSHETAGSSRNHEVAGSSKGYEAAEPAEDSAEAYASCMSPVLRSSRIPVASLSRSHEAAGSSRSYEVAGSSRSYETAGSSRNHEVAGSSKGYEAAGLSRSREASGSIKSHDVAGLSRSHEAAGSSRSHETTGLSRSREAAGSSRSHEAVGASKSHDVAGSSRNHEAAGSSRSHETAGLSRSREAAGSSRSHEAVGSSRSNEAAGWSSSHEAPSSCRSQEATGLSRSHEATGLSRSHEVTGLSRSHESAAFSVRPIPRSSRSPGPTWDKFPAAVSSKSEETAGLSKNRGSGSSKSRSNRSQGASSSRGNGARLSKNHTTDKATSSINQPPKAKLLDAVYARNISRSHYTKKESMNSRDSSSSDDNIPLSRSFRFINSTHSD